MKKPMVSIKTVPLLTQAHGALRESAISGDMQLKAAADSVLSALVLVLRHEQAEVPAELAPYIRKLPPA